MIYTHGNPIYREVGSCSIYGQCHTELKVLSFYLILDRRGILARAQMYLHTFAPGEESTCSCLYLCKDRELFLKAIVVCRYINTHI